MTALPSFVLADQAGGARRFPPGAPAVLCFVKEDCPTSNMVVPLLEALYRALDGAARVWLVGQEAVGNALLVDRYRLTAPMLDDSALRVSYVYAVEIIPTLVLADGEGREQGRLVGYRKDEWQALFAAAARLAGRDGPAIDWDAYPDWRPGCGSRTLEPGIAERLQAESANGPLRARRIDIAPGDDEFEFMFDQGLTDGLPVVPPTPERVLRMLTGTRRDSQQVVAVVPPNMAPATVEKVAANAVMAGCKPAYLPVVIAALEAVCTDEFNIHGVMATTWGASPCIVVNGPIRARLGMNPGVQALGSGNRANATIGRALKLILRNIGGAKPGGVERSTLASPAKYTMCFPEAQEASPWEPLHVERGFEHTDSVVTVFALEGPRGIADQISRTGHALAASFGLALESVWHPKVRPYGDVLLVVCPEHAETLRQDGWSKARVRERIQAVAARPLCDVLRSDECGEGVPAGRWGPGGPNAEQLKTLVPKFAAAGNIHIVVAGGQAGKFSAIFGGWVGGPAGSMPVSRRIDE
ncbi:MAG: TlpA family protein disulfide reductase [Chloroflexi bacterium]|nr:TlpA family protein disulfide reductase [Chloroflexota bacterium]